MNYSSMINRLTGIKREQTQCAVASTTGAKTVINDKAVCMSYIWPTLGTKAGGIKRGELVVIGAFSKKDKCMYQIQVRGYAQTSWVNWHRPWLTKEMADAAMEAVIKADDESGNHGLYVYQIVEV